MLKNMLNSCVMVPMKFIKDVKDSASGDSSKTVGLYIKLKDLMRDNGSGDNRRRLIFNGLNPTPLVVRDVLGRLCAKEGGAGTLAWQAINANIEFDVVETRYKNIMLDRKRAKGAEADNIKK